ncbi:tail fiber domain-containing protein [Sphingomonas paeninsulae]|uniref:Tail fiber domain-containing protein n=1 Tax=Sphingomonas paeninsulae TaxID=2319844 RepID=A0A494TJ29_SPHPE|nr:tail fiber domain-containing protein [Sphingomonas paeninsulae]AYJ85781.1 tail fiber domain-containing protein [Sphingomonas paeninsulae]
MSGGGKTTTTSNESQKVELPAWMTQGGQDLYNKASASAAANPPAAYTGEMSPAMSANQNAASAQAAGSVGTGQQDLAAARAMTAGAASGTVPTVAAGQVGADQFDAATAAKYANPYTQQVQQSTVNQMKRQNELDHASLNDNVQAQKAFGGTRGALLESEQEKNQNQGIMDYMNTSNAAAYSDAQQQFERDRAAKMAAQTSNQSANLQADTTNASNIQSILDRMLASGAQMGNLGATASNLNTADINNLSKTGAVEQATKGDSDSAAYQEYLRMQGAPMDQYKDLMSILSGTPRDVTTSGTSTGTSKQSGGLLNSLLGAGQIAASAFSDPRLKRDVMLIERKDDGLGIYRYRYVWDDDTAPASIGVMADEVEQLRPWALGPVMLGYQTVDYSKLGGVQ